MLIINTLAKENRDIARKEKHNFYAMAGLVVIFLVVIWFGI